MVVSKSCKIIFICSILCLFVRRSHGCIATVLANPVCTRCPTLTIAANVAPLPVLTSLTSLNSDGCTVLTITCTGSVVGQGVTLVWFNNGVQVATSPSELMAIRVTRDITCASNGAYLLPLTVPATPNQFQAVTSVDCTSP